MQPVAAALSPRSRRGEAGDGASESWAAADPDAQLSPELLTEVEAVASGWMLEFTCHCLCRHFRDGRVPDFQRSRDAAQAIINGLPRITAHQRKAVNLCQFLARIAEGKSLGYHFESDQRISPLESALSIWTLLEKEESKLEKLHEDIRRLILIQAVAVYIEKGYYKEASGVLDRLDSEPNKTLRMKLAMIINRRDPYVPFLQNFNYNLLVDKIKSYIDDFLKKSATNFLIKAAMKEVEAKRLEGKASQDTPASVETNHGNVLEMEQSNLEDVHHISKRSSGNARRQTLRSSYMSCRSHIEAHTPLNPEMAPFPRIKKRGRTSACRNLQNDLQNLKNNAETSSSRLTGRKKQRWTLEEDRKLKKGVKEFGMGNWAKILIHYDFNNRTGVMLKDRWRTMSKQHKVSLM
ncbi:PREDICTED: telomeric repeat-binding factor 1 isoform X1 [Crocodylus porosus]|uniref:telomeric repeat-binding factor 1 isoform X1 n=1 Tax=Crocodylus porosus TaxID=8502 RepID=UPI00093D2330|nr:PREDICTED: telomeric repeat-binding factor 1 isoform X1 [Crocodylus porosus]